MIRSEAVDGKYAVDIGMKLQTLLPAVEHAEEADLCAEVLDRQVQIDRRLFKIPMPKQDLNRAQVGACVQPVRRKAVPQGVVILLIISIPSRSAIAITRATESKLKWFGICVEAVRRL